MLYQIIEMSTEIVLDKKGWTPERMPDQTGKTYIITGTTSGTGLEASRILISKGAKLIMLNRNPQKAAKIMEDFKKDFGLNIDLKNIVMDLGDQDSVKGAANEILENTPRIDALICNGAIAQVPELSLNAEGWESQMAVNYFGHYTLQALLYPLIKSSEGRIVAVGSLAYDMGLKTIKLDDLNWTKDYGPNLAYSHSKLAQIMSIYELQRRLRLAGVSTVKAYACHPGSSRTNLINSSGSMTMRIIFNLMKLSPLTQDAINGAYPELMCATEENLDQEDFYGPTGRRNWVGPVGAHRLEAHAKDLDLAKKLWERTEIETGIKWNF